MKKKSYYRPETQPVISMIYIETPKVQLTIGYAYNFATQFECISGMNKSQKMDCVGGSRKWPLSTVSMLIRCMVGWGPKRPKIR